MEVEEAVERETNESGGGEEQMETEREATSRKESEALQRAEWRLTQIDGPRH